MASAICLRLTFLWLALLAFTTQSDDSLTSHANTRPSVHPSVSIVDGSSGGVTTRSLVSVPTITNHDPSHQATHVPFKPLVPDDEYSLLTTTPIDGDTSSIGTQPPSSLGPGNAVSAHAFLHRSHREHLASRAKCPKSPLSRKIGYYQVDNLRMRRCHRVSPSQIITSGLTHLYFAFASIDPKTFEVVPAHPEDVRLYGEFTSRKTSSMQTWITLGGFTFSSADATRKTWSMMASQAESRKIFITSLVNFMKRYGFQGVELDWEYPSAGDRGGSANDAANLVALVREMRTAWKKDYGISATLPPDAYLRGFNAKGMEQYIDFFNYLSYDLRAPLSADSKVSPHSDIREIAKAAAALWKAQVDPKKVNLGLSKAGRGYTLSDSKCAHFNCKVSGPSKPGPCTNEAGLLANVEINDVIKEKRLKAQLVPDSMSKEVSWDNQWIGYDDDETFKMKIDWAAENCFGGTTLWSLDMDSGEGSGKTPDGVPLLPIAPAPGRSTVTSSTSSRPSTKTSQQSVPPQSPDSSAQTGSTQSSNPRLSATSLESVVSDRTTAAALVIPSIATIPTPSIAPDSMVAVGAIAVSGLLPLGVAIQKGLSEGQKATTNLSKSGSPKPDDVMEALGVLAGAYASIQILDKQARMLNINKIPPETKPVIEKFKTSLPSMLSGTKDTITHLTNSIKDPAKVNKVDIQKADKIMGEQGTVVKQIAPIIKPLVDWKPPKGVNDISLPGILTSPLPSPTLGDGWKGTVIPGTLTVASPSIPWDAALKPLAGAAAGGGGGGGGAGAGGGVGGGVSQMLSGLLDLAGQAEGAVRGAVDAVNGLTSLCRRDEYSCPINFPKLSNALSQLTAATEDVGGLGAGLDAIELDTFPPADISRVVSVQNANRNLFGILKGTLSDLARIVTSPPQALQLLKKHSPAYVAGGAVLALLSQSNGGSIGALPWNAVGAKKGTDEYFLVTVPNTTEKAFRDFIKRLPDKGVGPQRLYEWPRRYQTYLGKMTRKEAEAVNKDRIVAVIGPNSLRVVRASIAKFPAPKKAKRMMSGFDQKFNETRLKARVPPVPVTPWHLERRNPSAYHLKMLSRDPTKSMRHFPPRGRQPEDLYLHERTSGRGATIFIMEPGFTFLHQASATKLREFFRPGVANGPNGNYEIHWPNRIPNLLGPNEGGDIIAALALGNSLGVANKATVVGVKSLHENGLYTLADEYDNWRWIVQNVQAKGLQGKAVISYSAAWRYTATLDDNGHVDYGDWGLRRPDQADFFLPLLVDCWAADIVTVFGGGDRLPPRAGQTRSPLTLADNRMGSYSPHRFANSRNPIIVVGPVARSGQYPFTSWVVGARTDSANGPEPFLKGEYTVHALGVDVEIIDEFTPDSYIRGTSPALAVPQIAGLAAYILTLPGLRWPPGSVSKLVKDWIVSKKRHGPDIPGPISPDGEDVAYNDAYNILQRCVPGSNLYGPPQFVGRPAEFPNDAPGQPPQSLPPVVNQEPPNVGPPGRRWSADFSTLSNILRRVYKRQPKAQERKVQETLIFENDHLTDPKYSNQFSCKLPGGYQPAYDPVISLPITNETCFSDPKFGGTSISFHETDMSPFINDSCTALKSFPNRQKRPAKNDKGVELWLVAANVTKPVDFKLKDCMDGFFFAMNNCDFEQPDKKFGGYVGVGDIQYFVYAGKAVSSTSSSKAAVPSRSPAPPPKGPPSAPPNSPPKPNPWVDEVCNDLFLSESAPYRKFDRHEMYNFINKTCASPPPDDNRHLNAFSITNNGELTMDLKSTGRSMKRPWDAECIQGFTAIVDNCDRNMDKKYGGYIIIQQTRFDVAARETNTDPKKCDCAPKVGDPFKRPDMVNWIREFCEGTNALDTDLTRFKDGPGNEPLVEFHVHPVKKRQVTGLDKTFCTKGFETAIDHCNKGDDKKKGDLWGGKCTLNDIVFQARSSPPPKDKDEDKPAKDGEFGEGGDLGLGDEKI